MSEGSCIAWHTLRLHKEGIMLKTEIFFPCLGFVALLPGEDDCKEETCDTNTDCLACTSPQRALRMLLNLLLLLLNVHVLELMFEYKPTGSQLHSRLETRLSAGPLSPALCFFQSRLCITIYSTVCFALRLCWGISLDALDRWDIAVMRSSSLLHGLLLTLPTFLENYFRK